MRNALIITRILILSKIKSMIRGLSKLKEVKSMSRCVIYQSGGFTNYGISYRKYSQEELAEMGNRAVTENEKAINILEHMKNLVTVRIFEEEALDRAIKALENQQDIKNALHDKKKLCQNFVNRTYKQEQYARGLLKEEPDREDVKEDLNNVIKAQDRNNALIEFIEFLEDILN